MTKRALILGVGGQDGSYLAEFLLKTGYEVHGMVHRSSVDNLVRIRHLLDIPAPGLTIHRGDLTDPVSMGRVLWEVAPDEIYNFADQDNVDWSYRVPAYNYDVTFAAVGRLLEQVRDGWGKRAPEVRIFQPISATIFGAAEPPQNELTPLAPASPYACAKAAALLLCQHYRREYGMYVSTAIYFNHDSPRRGEDYLLHRIAAAARRGDREFACWNPEQRVDIGFAGEYAEAAWQVLQLDAPSDDYCIGTGEGVSIGALVYHAYDVVWAGCLQPVVTASQGGARPGGSPTLIADCRKAREAFGWAPQVDAFGVLDLLLREGK